MTGVHEHSPAGAGGHGGVRSEEDHVPVLRLILVGVAALFIFFVGSFLAVSYERWREVKAGPPVIPPEIGQNKIGLVEQQVFDLAVRGQRQRAQQLEQLRSMGWVNRDAGIAHIPIEDAMRLVASGVRVGPTQGAPATGGQP